MRKFVVSGLMICTLAVAGLAQNASLEAAMQKFRNAVVTKNTNVFLSFISRSKGLTIMNTIDQGEAGNADHPKFDSNIKYAAMVTDFRKKGDLYRNFFTKSQDDPSLFDNFAASKGKWELGADDKLMPLVDGAPNNAIYVKWAKEGNRWYAVEIGRPIS